MNGIVTRTGVKCHIGATIGNVIIARAAANKSIVAAGGFRKVSCAFVFIVIVVVEFLVKTVSDNVIAVAAVDCHIVASADDFVIARATTD